MSPTARSLAWLRDGGWTAGVVERWNPGARVRQDFLGFEIEELARHAQDGLVPDEQVQVGRAFRRGRAEE